MKKLLAILLALSLAITLAACGGPSDEEIKAVRNVSFEGTELTVTLGTNKSTGYEWDYEIYGDCIEPSINRSFQVTGGKGDATGEVSIGFEGKSEGTAVVVFTTPVGWDGTGEGDGYTVNVMVGADGTIEKANGMEGAFPAATPKPVATPVPEPKTTIAIDELLSTPYADMLRSGNYQYSYPLTHEGISFMATIAAKDGMACRSVVSEDGAFDQRVLSKDGKAYQIDDLSGAVQELGAEEYETLPDYAGTLTFVAAKTLETGAVAEAYDFEYEGKPCNVVFVFSEGKLVEFVTTVDGATAETFVADMTGAPDAALFEMPQ